MEEFFSSAKVVFMFGEIRNKDFLGRVIRNMSYFLVYTRNNDFLVGAFSLTEIARLLQ